MRRHIILGLLLVAGIASAQTSDVLVTVNGFPIKKEDIANRIWAQHANEALNQMVDEIVAQQALAGYEAKASASAKESWKKEVDARFKRLKGQFKDDADFNENLKKAGVTAETLRRQTELQVIRENFMTTAKKITVSPAEAKAFYEANKDKMGSQESVRLRHILVAGEQQAKDLAVAVRVGADFNKLAAQMSLDSGSKDRGGDLGFVTRGMMVPDIEKVAFTLKPGEVSDPVKTQLGFHLFKVEEKKPSRPATFKDVEKELTQGLLGQKINQAWAAYVKELRAASDIKVSPAVTAAPAAGAPPR